jgi:hypothetical protein
MRELLQRFGFEQHRRPDEIAVEFLANAVPGTRSNTLAATISALVITGFDDATIMVHLEPVYHAIMAATGERISPMGRMVASIRRRMSLNAGAAILPVTELGAALGLSSWSIFR